MASKQRDAAKERFWRRVLRQWQRSGLSVRAFCDEQGLPEPSFYAWRRAIRARDAEVVPFVPVRVVPPEKIVSAANGAGCGLELVLGTSRVLRIGPGFDGPTLQRLLAVLEEGRPC